MADEEDEIDNFSYERFTFSIDLQYIQINMFVSSKKS